MKTKIFTVLITALCLLVGCNKSNETSTEKFYQIINNSSVVSSGVPYLDASFYEIIVYQYMGDEIIKEDNIAKVGSGGGKSTTIQAEELCDKVRVSFKFLPKESELYDLPENYRFYTANYYLLEAGKTVAVIIDDYTDISTSLYGAPSKNSAGGFTISEILRGIDTEL